MPCPDVPARAAGVPQWQWAVAELAYAERSRRLMRAQVPRSTFIMWLSPPARHDKKVNKPDLPAEWIRLYDQVAQVMLVAGRPCMWCTSRQVFQLAAVPWPMQELDFYKPRGPAYHLDLYQVGTGVPALCSLWVGKVEPAASGDAWAYQVACTTSLH